MKRRILAVDDSEINRKLLKKILSGEFEVLEAGNGQEALDMLAQTADSISAVLLDIMMPVLDGYGVLERMQGDPRLAGIPVIVMTGNDTEKAEVKALSLGALDFVLKPYDPVVIKHRISNMIKLRETSALVNSASRDELTGLYNRAAFIDRAAQLIGEHEAGYYVIACFDINNFKVVNDQYGSDKGDEVLRYIADVFRRGFDRVGGICCRVMADNFAVLYPKSFMGTPELAGIRRQAAELDGSIPPLSFSVGRYIVDDLSLSVSAMYDRASLAESSVKARYDINIALYDESMRENLLREQRIISEMDGALENGEFEVWFQPQYNHASGALIGAEALVRWRQPGRGLVPPLEFIPVFERNGFIYEMDKFVWDRSCALLRGWLDEGRSPLPVSVNVSRYDILCEDFFETITGILERYSLPVELLRIEITESAFTESSGQIIAAARRLIDYGFTVEIDDFGSGYSSLNTLKDVPADVLKLDMRFLENDEMSQRGGNILESIVRMSRWLGMSVIAEGVETLEQANYLKSIGCKYLQGYLYARPMPAGEYESFAKDASKEEKMLSLETVETLDNNAFWNPKSMDTLIFNSYVGSACIFEFQDGDIELLRVNDKYIQLWGGAGMNIDTALKLRWAEHLDEDTRRAMASDLERSARTGEEVEAEYIYWNLPGCPKKTYLRSNMRVIAVSGDMYLVYCIDENMTAQREAENKEREISGQLDAIVNNVNGGVSAIAGNGDGTGRFIFTNKQNYEMFGYTEEQFARECLSPHDFVHPDDRERVGALIAEQAATGAPFSCVYRAVRRDKRVIWVESNVSMTSISGVDGVVHISVTNDITAQREAAQKERETAEQLHTIMSNINGGVSATVIRGVRPHLLFANEQYYAQRGFTKEQYDKEIGCDGYSLIHPDDRERMKELSRRASLERTPFSAVYRVIKRDGSAAWMQTNVSITFFSNIKEPVQLIVTNDITHQVESEQREREAAERLKAIMDNISGGITATVMNGQRMDFLFANDRYYELLGYTRRQYHDEVADPFERVLCQDRKRVRESVAGVNLTGETRTIEYCAKKRGGEVIWLRGTTSMTRFTGVDAPVLLGEFTDITQQKNQESEALESADQIAFLNEISRSLLADGGESAIDGVLERIRGYFSASRAYIIELDRARQASDNTYEACAEGVVSEMANLQGVPRSATEYWWSTFEDGGYINIESVSGLDDSRAQEREMLVAQGISSLIAVPMRRDGELIGFIGLDDPKAHQRSAERLRAIGDCAAVMLTRRDLNARMANDSEALFTAMVEAASDFSFVKDKNLSYICCSPSFARMAGLSSEREIGGKSDYDLFERELAEKYRADDLRLIEGGEPLVDYFEALPDVDGMPRLASTSKYLLRDSEGGFIGLYGTGRDVTERQRTEEQLRIRDEEYRLAIAHSGRLVYRYDHASQSIDMPSETAEFYGLPERIENMPQGMLDTGTIAPGSEQTLLDFYIAIRRGDASGDMTICRKKHDGSYGWFKTRFSNVFGADGRPVSAIIVFKDITDRRAEEIGGALDRARMLAALRTVYPVTVSLNLTKGLFHTLSGAEYLFVSGAQSGSIDDLISEGAAHMSAQYASEFKRRFKTAPLLETLSKSGASERFEFRIKYTDGSEHWVEALALKVDNDFDDDAMGILLCRSINEQKKAESALSTALELNRQELSQKRVYQSTLDDSMPVGTIIFKLSSGEVLHMGGTLFRDLGYDEREILNIQSSRLKGFVLEEDYGSAFSNIRERLNTPDKTVEQEYRVRKKDGGTAWLYEKGTLVKLDGELAYIIVCVDVTRQKEMEEQLRVSEEELRLSMSLIGKMVCIYDIKTHTLTVPQSYAEKHGYPVAITNIPERVENSPFFDDKSRRAYIDSYKALQRGEKTSSVEYYSRCADGSWCWERAEAVTVFSSGGEPIKAIISVEDVTRQREMASETNTLRENERVLQLVAEHSNRMIYQYNIADKTITPYSSSDGARKLKADTDELVARGIVLHESADDCRRALAEIASGVPAGGAKLHIRSLKGENLWLDMQYSLIYSDDGTPKSAVLSFLDITENHEKELAYDRYLQTIEEDSAKAGRLIYLEADITADRTEKQGGLMLPGGFPEAGCTRAQVLDFITNNYVVKSERRRCRDFFSREHLITEFSDGTRSLTSDWEIAFPDGREGYIRSELQMVQDPYTGHIKVYTTLLDVTEEKLAALKVQRLAETDGMTGIYNSATTRSLISQRLERDDGSPCALLVADLDNLKAINDTFGHAEGDKAIKLMADTLRAQFRSTDIVGRIGGDEFAALIDGVDNEARLRSLLASFMRQLSLVRIGENGEIELRGSVGVASGRTGKDSYDELFKKADRALYHIKRNGKNDFAIYRPEMDKDAYRYKGHDASTPWRVNLTESDELNHLLGAVSQLYPLAISANLTQNSYYMLQYDNFTTTVCPTSGVFDELVKEGAKTFSPEDRQSFIDAFSRKSLLAAHARGEKRVSHTGRQLGDDGVWRTMQTDAVFVGKPGGDVLEISLAREITPEPRSAIKQ